MVPKKRVFVTIILAVKTILGHWDLRATQNMKYERVTFSYFPKIMIYNRCTIL